MEPDKRYFFEGLFIIVLTVAGAFFFVWLGGSGHRDDVLYRIHFAESVSGLALGDPVKFRGVDVGTVKAMTIDAGDPRLVQVDVKLRKETPVKTDTKASLKLKGITGVVFIELSGGGTDAKTLRRRHA
jgi:phospholipid/cholesterol/gamma-HCH transport system substrate-binding protein